jgi:O-antigen ligase
MLALRREVIVEGIVGVGVLLCFLRGRARIFAGMAAVLFAGAVVVLVGVSDRWKERIFSETRDQMESVSDPRTVLLLNTPKAMMGSPVLGHGAGSYRYVMGKYLFGSKGDDEIGIAAHNSFSRAGVETGLLGLGGFTLMIGALGWKCYFGMRRAMPQRGVLRLACAMIFLHVMDWLFFGDGIGSNTTWYFIGVLLFFDRRLSQNSLANRLPRTGGVLPTRRNWRANSHA